MSKARASIRLYPHGPIIELALYHEFCGLGLYRWYEEVSGKPCGISAPSKRLAIKRAEIAWRMWGFEVQS